MEDHLYTVNRAPFAVPSKYTVVGGVEGGSQLAFVVRVTTPHPTNPGEGAIELLIRRLPGAIGATLSTREARVLIARFVKLHTNIHPDCTGIQPLVDVYRSQLTPGDLYIVYPPASLTLAAAGLLGASLSAQQIAVIAKELARTLKVLHMNGIAVGSLRPDAVLVDAALGVGDSVRISDLITAFTVPPTLRRPAVVAATAASAKGATAPPAAAAVHITSAASPTQHHHHATTAAPAAGSASTAATTAASRPTDDAVHILQVADALLGGGGNTALAADYQHSTRLWYRAPELVLGAAGVTVATSAADMWSLGCVVLELATRRPFLPASDQQQYAKLLADQFGAVDYVKCLGDTPWTREATSLGEGLAPSSLAATLAGVDQRIQYLVAKLLRVNPAERLAAADILNLPFFGEVVVPPGALVGAGQTTSGTSKAPASSAARAAEAAALAAAAAAPIVLPPHEIIASDWALKLSSSDSTIATTLDVLLSHQASL